MPSLPKSPCNQQENAKNQSQETSSDDAREHQASRREFTLEETFGSVKPLGPSLDVLEACRLGKEEKVARSLAELKQQSRE